MHIQEIIRFVGELVDVAGVALIVIGISIASGRFLYQIYGNQAHAYQKYREGLGRTLLLGLEFLVAADIIKTVAITPNLKTLVCLH